MSYFPGMQKGNLDSVEADEHGKIKKQTVALEGVSVTRVTFDVGARWSTDLKVTQEPTVVNCHTWRLFFPERFGSSWTMVRSRIFQRTMSCCCRQVMMRGL